MRSVSIRFTSAATAGCVSLASAASAEASVSPNFFACATIASTAAQRTSTGANSAAAAAYSCVVALACAAVMVSASAAPSAATIGGVGPSVATAVLHAVMRACAFVSAGKYTPASLASDVATSASAITPW